MNKISAISDVEYILTGNGIIANVQRKLKLEHKRILVVLIVLVLTWLPLVVLNAIDGTLYGGFGMPFLEDIAMQVRILLGISLLILIKPMVFQRVPRVLEYISEVLVAQDEVTRFKSAVLGKAKKNMDSLVSEIVILLFVIGFAISPASLMTLLISKQEFGSWILTQRDGKNELSMAGSFAQYVSKPVFQFLVLRWLWRYIVWIVLLFRLSRMKLNLNSTHPDGSGGISIIYIGHRNFILFFMVCGVVISAMMVSMFVEDKSLFEATKIEIAGYIVFSILLLCFPFLFFMKKLVDLKYDGQFELSQTGVDLSRRFEDEWSRSVRKDKRIIEYSVDPSMHYDYSSIFKLVQGFRFMAIRVGDITAMIIMLFIPFLPIYFIRYPVAELVEKLMGLLF